MNKRVKNKIGKLLLLVVMLLYLSGCVKYSATMDIKKNKSMQYEILYAIDTEQMKDQVLLTKENIENLKKQGFKLEEYSQGTLKGYKITKKIRNINSVSSRKEVIYSLSDIINNSKSKDMFQVKKGLFKNKYKAMFNINVSDSNLKSDELGELQAETSKKDSAESTKDPVSYNDNYDNTYTRDGFNYSLVAVIDKDISDQRVTEDDKTSPEDSNYEINTDLNVMLNVKLPYSAISNNATYTSDDNKNLVWNMTNGLDSYIMFEFELRNTSTIVILVLLVVIVVGGVIYFTKFNKKGLKLKGKGKKKKSTDLPTVRVVPKAE